MLNGVKIRHQTIINLITQRKYSSIFCNVLVAMETVESPGWYQGAKWIVKQSWATFCEELIIAISPIYFKQHSKTEYHIVPSLFNLFVGCHGNGKGFWVTTWYHIDVIMETHPKKWRNTSLIKMSKSFYAIHKNEYNISKISIKMIIGCHGNGRE